MYLLKNCLIPAFFLALTFSLFAEHADSDIGQAPPYTIPASDTTLLPFQKTDTQIFYSSAFETVEDTLLPPCDVIFYKSGKLEYCKIIETAPSTITYKMCDYQDGPNIVVNKSDVHKIRYANGKEEIVAVERQSVNAYVKPRKDSLATLSMIFGLSSVATIFLFGIVIPALALAGLVLGIISILKIRRKKGELRGMGAAIVGVILCALVLILLLSL